MRESLCRFLSERFPACRVLGANDGEESVGLASALCPAVVVMDLNMPRMNGFEATAQIRKVAPRCGVIAHSLDDCEASRTKAAEAGAHIFLAKGGGVLRLTEAIRQFLPAAFA